MSSRADLLRSLAVLCELPGPGHQRLAEALGLGEGIDAASHTELFVLQCPPYESLYTGPDGMLGGEGADQVAGFHRAIGLVPPAEPDHLAAILGLYAALLDGESGAGSPAGPGAGSPAVRTGTGARAMSKARQVLLVEHLLSWVPVFLEAVGRAAHVLGIEPYLQWAALLTEALAAEALAAEELAAEELAAEELAAEELAGEALLAEAERRDAPVTLPRSLPRALPRSLRVAPGLPEPDDGTDSLVRSLVSPVRSGMVLSRLDVARAGRETGVPGRVGERRFALTSMLGQAPAEILAWLSEEATSWEGRHLARAAESSWGGEVTSWWAGRASTTAARLAAAAAAPPVHAGTGA